MACQLALKELARPREWCGATRDTSPAVRTQQLGGLAVPELSPTYSTAVDQRFPCSELLWLVLPALCHVIIEKSHFLVN